MRILDCTLRDGGYYTDWDFPKDVVERYISCTNILPIEILEIGYRNLPSVNYMGKFGYCPAETVELIRKNSTKQLAIMLNEKSTTVGDLETLLSPVAGMVDIVRMAVAPNNLMRACDLASAVRNMGFKVGFNVMYMSKWLDDKNFMTGLHNVNDVADIFSMVDSYGGVMPEDVADIVSAVKDEVKIQLGFHGHNNLELALANSLCAASSGVDVIDATVKGMGRGAGNLNLELLLTVLNQKNGLEVDFNVLGDLVSAFMDLYKRYEWGTNLPYMISGANNIPQSEVMEWVTNRVYSFNSIVRALSNRKNNVRDNAKYPVHKFEGKYMKALIVGGGDSVPYHADAIRSYAVNNDVALIFTTGRHAGMFRDLKCDKFYVLVGSESQRLSANIGDVKENDIIILPPYPREMGTEVPDSLKPNTYELPSIDFMEGEDDSCTTVALQIALNVARESILAVGYDGYKGNILSEKEMSLTRENQKLFNAIKNFTGKSIVSLTPTIYKELDVRSIYQFI